MEQPATSISLSYASMLQESTVNLLKRKDLCLTIRHDRIIIYKGKDSAYHGKKRDPLSDKNLQKRKYQGTLSSSAIKHVSKQLTLWADSISQFNNHMIKKHNPTRRRMVMITVTLSATQEHTDNEIKRTMLVPFIDSLKYNHGIEHYFWRAEKQKNGNIHFHIIIDKYVDKDQIRKLWNTQQKKLGYIYRFAQKHGHTDPPSTDIFAINNHVKGIKYGLKYCLKTNDEQKISGKIWGMSDSLRNIKNFTVGDAHLYLNTLDKYMKMAGTELFEDEHFFVIKLPKHPTNLSMRSNILEQYRTHLLRIYYLLYDQDQKFCTDQTDTIYTCLDYQEMLSLCKHV